MIKTRSVSDFFKTDKPVWAVYDATRKLPSFVDGFKNSQRKLMWVGFDKLVKDYVKTETYCNIVALDTAYIHGSGNLCTVCDSLVQDFIGACNYSYFIGNDSGWGSRLLPKSSAPRYTKLKLSEISKCLFKKVDNDIYDKQWFEGQYIEPQYLVPIFPTLFLNSSNGLTAGFSENIYSRNPDDIITYIKKRLASTEHPRMDLPPWFRGYKGTIVFNKDLGIYESIGNITQNNTTSYTIDEIPVETSYQKYIEFLDKLCDDGVIQDYEDHCDPRTNAIKFEIKTTRDFSRKHSNFDSLVTVFKLRKSLPEQYNCIDENGRVKEFKNIQEILDSFIDIRLEFYNKRKAYLQKLFGDELDKLNSKYLFVKNVCDGKIVVSKQKKDAIVKQIETFPKILKIDGNYDYLLSMPLHSLTHEKLEELKNQIASKTQELNVIKAKSIEDMWIEDLNDLKKYL